MSRLANLWNAGVATVAAWGAYGVVELVHVNVIRFIPAPEFAWLSAWHWMFNLVTLACYAVIGFLLGAGAYAFLGLFKGMDEGERALRSRAAALLPMPIVFALQLVVVRHRTDAAALFLVVVAAFMAVGLLCAFFRGSRSGWLGRLWSPWRIALLLVFLPWILDYFHDDQARPVVLAVAAAILVLVAVQYRFSRGTPPLQANETWVAGLLVASLLDVIIAHHTWSPRVPEPTAANTNPSAPNVILVVLDTVRADHLSVYGYDRPTTPQLEEFAGRATLYRHPVSPSNYTLPVHASLFTGLYPRRLGVEEELPFRPHGGPLAPEFDTMAERLSSHGYRTMAFSANIAYVTPDHGFDQGFQVFRSPRLEADLHCLRRGLRRAFQYSGIWPLERRSISGTDLVSSAQLLIEGAAAQPEPFFVFMNLMEAHAPRVPSSGTFRQFDTGAKRFHHAHYLSFGNGGRFRLTAEERRFLIDRYDASVHTADYCVGRLLRALEASGEWDNTLIIVTSDHGEGLGDDRTIDHGRTLYEHQIFVPLLIKFPQQQQAEIVDGPVSIVDLLPTVLDAAGIEAGGSFDGRSLLSRSAEPPSAVFAGADLEETNRTKRQWAAVSDMWKLIATQDGNRELYNLAEDPTEDRDLSSESSERTARMLGLLDHWFETTPKNVGNAHQLDPAVIDRLRGLGYIQ